MLDAHGTTIYEDTIVALRLVKDELNRVDGVMKFKITSELLSDVKGSWGRYEANRLERMTLKEVEKKNELKEVEVTNKVTQTEKDMVF